MGNHLRQEGGVSPQVASMPPRVNRQAHRGGRGRSLKLETHNVCGMRAEAKVQSLARGWVQRGSDIVCLQETHVGFFDQGPCTNRINTACRQQDPQHRGFSIHWGFNANNANRSAGVAIMIRRDLITSGELVPHEDGKVGDQGGGRFLKLPVSWRGQRMNIVCVHLPNKQHEQVQFIRTHLAGIAGEPGFWGGDYNFVLDTPLDRLSEQLPGAPPLAQVPQGRQAAAPGFSDSEDEGSDNEGGQVPVVRRQAPRPARVFAEVASGMKDCFRLLHPRQRSFTWHGVGGRKGYASRIDRWHCSSQFAAYVVRCGTKSPSPSDHRPLVVEILSRRPATQGRGYRRVRLNNIWADEQARGDLISWVEALVQEPPTPSTLQQAEALLSWWPGAKGRLVNECSQLNRKVRAAFQAQAAAQGAAPAAELEAAYTAVEIFHSPARVAASIERVVRARKACREAVNKVTARTAWQARKEWVHSREQPSKGLTVVLQSQLPVESRSVSGLVSPATGRLVTAGRPMAQLMATYQANISQASPRDPVALQEVLDALSRHGISLSAAEAGELGSLTITPEEVKQALKQSAPGKAPGLDGIPVELYRRCGDAFIPLLANIYTAMGMTGKLPKGLLDGVITSIFKKGQRADPANYRPITVLNSDYRVLAKVLANRLKRCIAKLIHPMQSGFVPGRLIGDNILLNQMLPSAVGAGSMAAAVYCDFRKAYDTVDRNFLYAAMEALGVGDGFIKWVKLLLSSTSACAQINGHLSRTVPFTAGVRQGCPLAPYLYLFVTEALFCFLQDRDFGVQVGRKKLVACMYADDNQSYLSNMFTELRLLKQALHTFHEATGEGVNFGKSHVLPIGKGARTRLWEEHHVGELRRQHPFLPQAELVRQAAQLAKAQLNADKASIPPDLQMEGFKVVDKVVSLGISFRADGTVSADWDGLLSQIKKSYTFLSRPPLSVFGRGVASASYGISKLLYAAEFVGMPPPAIIQELNKITAKLVDRGMAPDAQGRAFAGIRKDLLAGHPSTGGFGVMPWEQHIRARHAMWAVRMMLGSPEQPWIYVGRWLLCPLDSKCAAWHRIGIALCHTEDGLGPSNVHINPCLTRIASGFRALGQWHDGGMGSLQPGPWCACMPLWCNPFIRTQGQYGNLPAQGLEDEFSDFAQIHDFTTLQQAIEALGEMRGGTLSAEAYDEYRDKWFHRSTNFLEQSRTHDRLTALLAAIPSCWKDAVVPGAQGLPSSEAIVLEKLLPRVHWRYPSFGPVRHGSAPVCLLKLKVKLATRLQLGPLLQARGEKHAAFLQEACISWPAGHGTTPAFMLPIFKKLWALPWDNNRKEVYWRLTLDALPTAARMHMQGEPCNCGVMMPNRAHHFWDCPVALAVRNEIERGLNHGGGQHPVERHHVWLCCPPGRPGLHAGVWQVVCLAAVLAMDSGRKVLAKWRLEGDLGAHRNGARPPPPLPQRVPAASRVAKAAFWDYVQDFVCLDMAPATWAADITTTHPFIKLHQTAAGDRKLRLHKV